MRRNERQKEKKSESPKNPTLRLQVAARPAKLEGKKTAKNIERKQSTKKKKTERISTVHPDLVTYIWIELPYAKIETHFLFYSTVEILPIFFLSVSSFLSFSLWNQWIVRYKKVWYHLAKSIPELQ